MIISYNIFKSKDLTENPFQATILIGDKHTKSPFEHVSEIGIRKGLHGMMIENVNTFKVEIFDIL